MSMLANKEQTNPYIDIDIIEKIYDVLGSMTLELDDNPLSLGPKRLNKKVAEAQRIRVTCSSIEMRVSRFLQRVTREHRTAELEYELQLGELLATSPEVRSGRNLEMQKAIANMKLNGEFRNLHNLSEAVRELEMVLSVVRARARVIADSQRKLKDQIKLCERELETGAYWGTQRPGAKIRVRYDPIISEQVNELDAIITKTEQDMEDAIVVSRSPLPVETRDTNELSHPELILSGDIDDSEADEFLDNFDVSTLGETPQENNIDIEDLLK